MAKMELVRLESTKYVPNSTFPVIIYRNVLPVPDDQDTVKALLNGNGFRVDGFFGPYGLRHYHSNTHETYAFTAGQSTIILGRSESPDDENGTEIQVSKGDVLIIPAGTAHCNKTSSDDFLYAASYPKDSPHWDVRKGTEDDETKEVLKNNASQIPPPESDPIFGRGGPMVALWEKK